MTWEDVGGAVEELAAQIEAAQFTPDAVLALAPVSYTHLTLPTIYSV